VTPKDKFFFDVNGYINIPGVLSPEQVTQMLGDMDKHGIREPDNNPNLSRFGGFLEWGEVWRSLIDHPRIYPFLTTMLGPKFRLDHAYGMAMRADGKPAPKGRELHHHSHMYHHASYYLTHQQMMHNGLIVVSYALTDIPPGSGGFICIPGSHKASFEQPPEWFNYDDNPMVRQIPQKAGDVLIFTESLSHGTAPWTNTANERRSVLLKYCPHYMQWGNGAMKSDFEGLTERQKMILERAYVWDRKAL